MLSERHGVPLIGFDQPERRKSRLVNVAGSRPKSYNWLARSTARRGAYEAYITSGEDIGLPLVLALRARGDAAVVNIITHGSYFGSAKFHYAMRLFRAVRNVRFLCLSKSLECALVERFGVAENAVETLGYGVDTTFFAPEKSSSSSGVPIIASAGLANRDYATLVAAAGALDVEIRIAADSAWHPNPLAVPNGGANIEMRSHGTYEALRDLYAEAAIVVVPLHDARHACGYAVALEAMAMGRTVVLTRTGAPPDFLIDGRTGYFVEPGDIDGLRRLITELLQDRQRRETVGLAAREMVATSFALDSYVDRLYEAARAPSAARSSRRRYGLLRGNGHGTW